MCADMVNYPDIFSKTRQVHLLKVQLPNEHCHKIEAGLQNETKTKLTKNVRYNTCLYLEFMSSSVATYNLNFQNMSKDNNSYRKEFLLKSYKLGIKKDTDNISFMEPFMWTIILGDRGCHDSNLVNFRLLIYLIINPLN